MNARRMADSVLAALRSWNGNFVLQGSTLVFDAASPACANKWDQRLRDWNHDSRNLWPCQFGEWTTTILQLFLLKQAHVLTNALPPPAFSFWQERKNFFYWIFYLKFHSRSIVKCNVIERYFQGSFIALMYRVTHQVVANLLLTSQKFQARPAGKCCFDVNGRIATTWCVTL